MDLFSKPIKVFDEKLPQLVTVGAITKAIKDNEYIPEYIPKGSLVLKEKPLWGEDTITEKRATIEMIGMAKDLVNNGWIDRIKVNDDGSFEIVGRRI